MFVLETVCGGKATEKKFDTCEAAFNAMKKSFKETTGKSELEIAQMMEGFEYPECEFSIGMAADHLSESFWGIYTDETA